MCGIVGMIKKDNICRNLIVKLKLLEYRGYDSAGIATIEKCIIKTTKCVGNVDKLSRLIDYSTNSHIGIAHTRWATHGTPSYESSHPHTSNDNTWAVVHNGIIENYKQLITQHLSHLNQEFVSDSQIIPLLLEKFYNSNPLDTIKKVVNLLNGSFALAILNANCDCIFIAKYNAPLFCACNSDSQIVASDITCMRADCDTIYSLNNNEIAQIDSQCMSFFDFDLNKIEKIPSSFCINYTASKKLEGYYMLNEIYATHEVIARLTSHDYLHNLANLLDTIKINNFNHIILVGCGTAYHACMYGSFILQSKLKMPCMCIVASEFYSLENLLSSSSLVIFISQSGETADTIASCKLAKKLNATTLSITNNSLSTLARLCKLNIDIQAGEEKAVASTKAYTAQLTTLYNIASFYAGGVDLSKLSNSCIISQKIQIQIENLSKTLCQSDNIFIIGKGLDNITATETALKIKEITYINCNSYYAGELKHGFLALVDDKAIVIVIATEKKLFQKTINNALEAKTRGAKLILLTTLDIEEGYIDEFHEVIKLDAIDKDLAPITSILPMQLLSFYMSINLSLNPDTPRNLAKSVTVE